MSSVIQIQVRTNINSDLINNFGKTITYFKAATTDHDMDCRKTTTTPIWYRCTQGSNTNSETIGYKP